MREIDTESAVVWPAWCYSGEGPETESTVALPPSLPPSVPVRARGKRRRDRMNGDSVHHQNNNTNTNNLNVKSERLSPTNTTTPDNHSSASRSRSVTPSSSYPGTPPQISLDRGPSPGGPSIAAGPHASLRPMEGIGRNYSDLIRSLAAKYHHNNPNDFFSSIRNGYQAPTMDPRYNYKLAAQFVNPNTMAPLTPSIASPSTSIPRGGSPTVKDTSTDSSKKPEMPSLFQGFSFAPGPLYTPLIDMSSTKTLMSMVKAAKEAQIQNFINSTNNNNLKRSAESSPLDLSSAGGFSPTPTKKSKVARSETFVDVTKPSSPNIRKCPGPPHCSGDSEVASWSVEDVCSFVSSIDICAEYSQIFRDQCIDGSGLPLLTEDHLTGSLGMKLGPALKLRSLLSRRLTGTCSYCTPSNSSGPPSPSTSQKDNQRPNSRSSNSNS